MVERRSKVILEAQTKGFEKARREVKSTFSELDAKGQANSMKGLNREIGEMTRQFRGLKAGLTDVNKLLRMQDGVKGIADMRKEVARLTSELDKLRGKGGGGDRGGGDRGGGIRGGFMSGFAQGSGMGEVFPQQGFGRNMAGRMAGRGVRAAGGFAGGAFSGASGFSQGLSGIPIVGGFMAGQMQSMLGMAGTGLQSLQQRRAMMPMMGAARLRSDLDTATDNARRRAIAANPLSAQKVTTAGFLGASAAVAKKRSENEADAAASRVGAFDEISKIGGTGALTSFRTAKKTASVQARKDEARARIEKGLAAADAARVSKEEAVAKPAEKKARAAERSRQITTQRSAVRRAERKAKRDVINAPFKAIEKMGQLMGIMPQQALQMAGGLTTAAGGELGQFSDLEGRSFMREAFGTQQMLGLDANVSGQFAKSAREGITKGGLGGAERAMKEAIRAGMAMSLEGSELTRYMQQTAQAMSTFEQTGMPLDPNAIGQMGGVMARAGLGGVRGSVVGQGMVRAGQKLSKTGPQSAVELLMFKTMFGFKGGGIEGYAEAQRQAETGVVEEGGVRKFLDALLAGSSKPGEGQLRLQAALQGLKIDVGAAEAHRMAGGDPAGMKELQTKISKAFSRSSSPISMGQLAEDTAAPGLKRQAGLEIAKGGIGRGAALGVTQGFEEGQLGVTAQVARLAPEMNRAAKALGDMATSAMKGAVDAVKGADKIVERAEAFLDRLETAWWYPQ